MQLRALFWNVTRGCLVSVAGALALPAMALAQMAPAPDGWIDTRVGSFSHDSQCGEGKELVAETVRGLQLVGIALSKVVLPIPPSGYPQLWIQAVREGCASVPLEGWVTIFIYFDKQVDLPADGHGRPTVKKHPGEGGMDSISMWLNRLPGQAEVEFAHSSNNSNPYGMILYKPTSYFKGIPVIDHHILLVTAPGHPPLYVPVPLERAFKLAIALHEKEYAYEVEEAKKDAVRMAEDGETIRSMKAAGATPQQLMDLKEQLDQITRQRLERARSTLELLKTKYAALTPAQRTGPTYIVRSANEADIPQAESDGDAAPLMLPNPDYFDAKVSRSVPQLMYLNLERPIDVLGREPEETWWWHTTQHVDWKAFAAQILH